MGLAELRGRRDRLRRSIGEQLRDLLVDAGVTQAALAAATGVDPGHLSRVVRGLDGCSLETLVRLGAGVGADVSLRLFPTSRPRIRDHIQVEMVEALLRRLDRRWLATPELPVPAARGVIDLALRLRNGELAVACEAHSQLRSVDLVLRRLREKAAALQTVEPTAAATSSVLLLRSTATSRSLVRRHSATFEAAFPGTVRQAIRTLTAGDGPWPGSTLLWVTVVSGAATLLERPPRGIRVGR